eukprot:TRINITY_DN16082_c0_g1_i1.p1 TRINITY_DN16082_c0_g1~~TRINITY_DN16082_c0_g1_i1.p1  ORF type:complete len:211 (+),score=34.04 TRINITY_DN16082_c0_g1_i1:176-808(+)
MCIRDRNNNMEELERKCSVEAEKKCSGKSGRTYSSETKKIMLQLNANTKAILQKVAEQNEERTMDLKPLSEHSANLVHCIENLMTLYDIPGTGIPLEPPELSLEPLPESVEPHSRRLQQDTMVHKILQDTEKELKKELEIQKEYLHRCQDLSLIHISEPTRPLYISYAVFCLKKKKKKTITFQSLPKLTRHRHMHCKIISRQHLTTIAEQ